MHICNKIFHYYIPVGDPPGDGHAKAETCRKHTAK